MAYNAIKNAMNFARPQRREADINSFDSQVHCDEMSFDKLTPEERIEFEAIHDEVDIEELETVEEFWTAQENLQKGS